MFTMLLSETQIGSSLQWYGCLWLEKPCFLCHIMLETFGLTVTEPSLNRLKQIGKHFYRTMCAS